MRTGYEDSFKIAKGAYRRLSSEVRQDGYERGGDALCDAVRAEIVRMHAVCDQKM